jgi:hypothetical protein
MTHSVDRRVLSLHGCAAQRRKLAEPGAVLFKRCHYLVAQKNNMAQKQREWIRNNVAQKQITWLRNK